MRLRGRRAARVTVTVTAWVLGVPLGLLGGGAVVQQVQTYRQHRLENDRAHVVLDRWAAAVAAAPAGSRRFATVGDLTGQDGDWELSVGGNDKQALLAGRVVVDPGTALPPGPGDGTVRWADGSTARLPLLSAAEGVQEIRRSVPPDARDCHGCQDLVVTGAVLGTATTQTDAGPAAAPVWRYTIAGTGVVLTRVAVRADAVTSVAALGGSRSTRGVVAPDGWIASADGRTLTVGFTGADGPGRDPCGADYAGRAVVSATGVVVVVRQTSPSYWRQAARLGRSYACAAVGRSRTVDIRLDAPLGGRTVLDLVTGTPLRRGLPAPPG